MAASPTDNGNSRITLARLGEKVDNLANEVRRMAEAQDRRTTNLEELLHCETADLRGRCQDNATNVARLEERQKATTGIQTVITVVLSTIAGFVGTLK